MIKHLIKGVHFNKGSNMDLLTLAIGFNKQYKLTQCIGDFQKNWNSL